MAKLTNRGIAKLLIEKHGNQAAVAKAFGVSRSAVNIRILQSDHLRRICIEARETIKDHAESALHVALLRSEPWAVCFFLKCQAKDRGYVERQEVDHSGIQSPAGTTRAKAEDLTDDQLAAIIADARRSRIATSEPASSQAGN